MPEPQIPIPLLENHIAFFERALVREEQEGDSDHTLFLQLTKFELVLIQYALFWLSRIYGPVAVTKLIDKLFDVIDAQEFCNCDSCVERRAEREEDDEKPDDH